VNGALRALRGRPEAYVADVLSHFVGHGHVTDDAHNWSTLQAILDSGELLAGGEHGAGVSLRSINPGESLTSNKRYLPSMVCFADIPAGALDLHVAKYGKFGVAFDRQWLVDRGTRPVTYVPLGVRSTVFSQLPTLNEEWEDLMTTLDWAVFRNFGGRTKAPDDTQQERIEEFIDGQRSYLKFFDPSLPQDHIDNYYLEREWRAVTGIDFRLGDIAALYVPAGWGRTAQRRYPELRGRIIEL
jgi:hypothetical protein